LAVEFPNIAAFRRELANTVNSLGGFYFRGGDSAEAERHWRRAQELFQRLADAFPEIPDYANLLGKTKGNLATLALMQSEPAAAQSLLEEAISNQRAALKSSPGHPAYSLDLRNHYWILAETLLRMQRHREAAAAAEELPRVIPDGWEESHRAGRVIARCVPLAAADAALDAQQREKVAREYTGKALEQLGRAVERGFRDGDQFDKDEAWTPLRSHPQFQQLRERLAKADQGH
jgi:serine/threonine-protein kinase